MVVAVSNRYTADSKRKSSMTHATRGWTCYCGRAVRGNGGKSSHQRACSTWAERTLALTVKRLAEMDADGSGLRHPDIRARWAGERDQLRERLGLAQEGVINE